MIIVYIFGGIIALFLILAAFMPGVYNIEKNIIINKSVATVMSRIGDLGYYSQWNPWQQLDKSTVSKITGTPMQPGHRYDWEGKKVGVGSLTLRDIDAKHIHFDLEFIKPWKSKAKDNWLFEPWGDNETKVTWQNSGQFPWPIARLMGPMITKNLSHQFQKGLENLKEMCEKAPV